MRYSQSEFFYEFIALQTTSAISPRRKYAGLMRLSPLPLYRRGFRSDTDGSKFALPDSVRPRGTLERCRIAKMFNKRRRHGLPRLVSQGRAGNKGRHLAPVERTQTQRPGRDLRETVTATNTTVADIVPLKNFLAIVLGDSAISGSENPAGTRGTQILTLLKATVETPRLFTSHSPCLAYPRISFSIVFNFFNIFFSLTYTVFTRRIPDKRIVFAHFSPPLGNPTGFLCFFFLPFQKHEY